MKLFELLEKHTNEKGNYSIYFNEHQSAYMTGRKETREYYTAGVPENMGKVLGIKHIDWSKNIYEVFWYKDNFDDFYHIFGNTVEDIVEQVREIIRK